MFSLLDVLSIFAFALFFFHNLTTCSFLLSWFVLFLLVGRSCLIAAGLNIYSSMSTRPTQTVTQASRSKTAKASFSEARVCCREEPCAGTARFGPSPKHKNYWHWSEVLSYISPVVPTSCLCSLQKPWHAATKRYEPKPLSQAVCLGMSRDSFTLRNCGKWSWHSWCPQCPERKVKSNSLEQGTPESQAVPHTSVSKFNSWRYMIEVSVLAFSSLAFNFRYVNVHASFVWLCVWISLSSAILLWWPFAGHVPLLLHHSWHVHWSGVVHFTLPECHYNFCRGSSLPFCQMALLQSWLNFPTHVWDSPKVALCSWSWGRKHTSKCFN